MSTDKKKLKEFPVEEFISEVASRAPVPGGGGTAALVGALGIALGGMVANLTIGKEEVTILEGDVASLRVSAYRLQKELSELIDKDAEVFAPLVGAYRMPENTDEEKNSKERVTDAFLKEAVDVPLEIMKKCAEAINIFKSFLEKGSALAISDVGCGAVICKAAMQAAWLNVCVEIKHIKDERFVFAIKKTADDLLEEYLPLADEVYEHVEEKLIE